MPAERTVTGRDPATGRPLRVTVAGGIIAAVGDGPPDETRWLAPGLIDLQVNGFGGHDLNAAGLAAETVAALTAGLRARGITTFVPTLVTAEHERITHALVAIAAARRADPGVRRAIPYVHLEGPHLSPEDGPRGVHDVRHIRPPDLREFDAWQAAAGDLVGLVTLSPHYPGADAYIRQLARRGVHVAIGHTHATPEQIHAAARAGARLSTHLGNGAHAVLPRHPNYLWSQLADDRLTAAFIADGHHLPADTLTAMLRAKGLDRSVLVSDAVALAGLPPGRYDTPVGGRVELSGDGRLTAAGTPYLAGAARCLADGVAHVVHACGLSLADALRLATARPGRFVGGRGRIEPGQPAELVRFAFTPGDPGLRPDGVWAGPEHVHS
ncbi:N-acetylglucosamine-6-phosphate deacetylase [Dactylosporangium sp. CA-233914]|uniref:N-acetylglucosamine-6-phosphate deacetylase n=1 Tax=Dactylosporangium sp. CA-233914 TaxID=3239934 RepID=UPI003D8D9202